MRFMIEKLLAPENARELEETTRARAINDAARFGRRRISRNLGRTAASYSTCGPAGDMIGEGPSVQLVDRKTRREVLGSLWLDNGDGSFSLRSQEERLQLLHGLFEPVEPAESPSQEAAVVYADFAHHTWHHD